MFQNIKKCFTTLNTEYYKTFNSVIMPLLHSFYISYVVLSGECVISSVLSCHSKNWSGRPVLQLGYSSVLFGKQGKIHPLGGSEGGPTQKKHGAQFWLLFLYDFSPPPKPALCKLG